METPDFSRYNHADFYSPLDLSENEKSRSRFIKDVERIIRTSIEYRNYIRYLRTEAKLTYCTALNKLPEEISSQVKIEMHHFPFSLYDLVETVLNKYLTTGAGFTRLSVANEVMEMHYFGRVGLVPLTVSFHQLAHSGEHFLTRDDIFGSYEIFLDQYKPFLNDIGKTKVALVENMTETRKIETLREYLELDPNLLEPIDLRDHDNFLSNVEERE